MSKKHCKFRIYGANEYVQGVISGMMDCMCRNNFSENIVYPIEKIVEVEEDGNTHVVSIAMAVDTTKRRFNKFYLAVLQRYNNLENFRFEIIE